MALSGKKLLVLCLMASMVAVQPLHSAAAQTNKPLQPQGLNHAGVYTLRKLDPNLTGSGVKFAVLCRSFTYIDGEPQNDYRPNINHRCFKNNQLTFNERSEIPAGTSPHATAACSILLGEDQNAYNSNLGRFHYQGVAPQATAYTYEFWHFLTNNIFPYSPPDADIITASFGTQAEDWWTRGIEAMVDQNGLIVVAGIGNGSDVYDPLLYPGAGSNVIGVGVVDSVKTENLAAALENFSLASPEHSSIGPTTQGQCKPDIVAPGNCLAADVNDPERYEPTGNWSSFSTPIAAGTLGLLVQKAKEDQNLNDAIAQQGGNCIMKALLLNSATKLPYWHKGKLTKDDDHEAPLDYIQGAGMVNALGAYENLIAGPIKPGYAPAIGWDNNQLDINEIPENIYQFTLTEPAGKLITATTVWNRHYNNTYPFEPTPDKNTNLRLELWAIDLENPENDYLLDYSDSTVDNLEHIHIPADANYTDYQLIVSFSNPDDPNQTERYGLAWNVTDKQNKDNILWYDLNADGTVDDADLKLLVKNALAGITSPDSYLLGDINADGAINQKDFQIFLEHKDTAADWYTEIATE